MLIFHEGLPRSGKSYAACRDHIVPILKDTERTVYAYIEGLNYQRFADVTGRPLEEIQARLIEWGPEDVKLIDTLAIEKDSFIVIDELQNFFPSDRRPLAEGITRFVAEHGHHGLDILAMGQCMRDCHALWKRRVQRKLVFTKRTGIGKPNSYKWEAYEATQPEKFERISAGTENYDQRYFGLYKSHVDGTVNKATLIDDRTNVLKTGFFKLGVPIYIAIALGAVLMLRSFFNEGAGKEPQRVDPPKSRAPAALPEQVKSMPVEKPKERESVDIFDEAARKGRVRLAGYVKGPKGEYGIIEVVDGSRNVYERLRTTQLEAMGWTVEKADYGYRLERLRIRYVATEFPVDSGTRVSDHAYQTGVLK